jgi:hypothetical protein
MQGDPLGGIVASAFKNTILDIDASRPITAVRLFPLMFRLDEERSVDSSCTLAELRGHQRGHTDPNH